MTFLKSYIKLLPLLILTGLSIPFYYFLLVVELLNKAGSSFKKLFTDQISRILIALIIYFFIRVSFVLISEGNYLRVFSTVQGAISFIVILLVLDSNPWKSEQKLATIFNFLIVIIYAISYLSITYYFVSGQPILKIPTWVDFVGNVPDHISALSSNVIYTEDYLLGLRLPRLWLFSPYPNGFAILICLLLLITTYLNKSKKQIHILLSVPLILFSMSRTTIGSLVFLTLALVLFSYSTSVSSRIRTKATITKRNALIGIFIFSITIILVPFIINLFDVLLTSREGSTSTRLISYLIGIDMAISENPIFGLGYKPKSDISVISVGSHSTPVGIFVKFGLLGIIGYVLLWYTILKKTVKLIIKDKANKHFEIALGILLIFAWQFTEDIDALLHLPVLFGLYLAFLKKYKL